MGLSVPESGAFITSHADHIKISEEGLSNCAADISQLILSGDLDMKTMFVKTEIHPQTADEVGIAWVVFADTLNFSFWQPEDGPQYLVTYKGTTYTGYLAMCAAINRALDSGSKLTTPEFYSRIKSEELGNLLVGDNGVQIPLLQDRVNCLHQVGTILVNKYGGKFSNLIQECDNSAMKLLDLVLENFSCFRDTAEFKGEKVSLHKRAQILVADLWCLFEGLGVGSFEDIEGLTMFADYRVPQSLQQYKVLIYDEEILTFLRKDEIMPYGHPYEVEIRGTSIHAVELLTRKIKDILKKNGNTSVVNSILVDQYLWGYRRKNAEEMKNFPYHKVRSIYY